MSTDVNKALVRRYFAAIDAHELDGLARDVLAPDFQFWFDTLPPFDAAGTVGFLGGLLAAMPDIRHEVAAQIAEGNLVASRIVIHGSHQGELQGIPPTGRTLAVEAINVHEIDGSRVVRQWVHSDALGLLGQLGVIPAGGDAGGSTDIAAPAAMPTGTPAELRSTLENALAAFNDPSRRDAYLGLYGDDLLTHGFPPQAGCDRTGLVDFYRGMWGAFPDARVDLLHSVAEGDQIAARYVYSGTQTGAFMGAPSNGREVRVGGATIMRFAGDRVVERWQRLDDLGLLQQLGLLPAPGAS